MAHCAQLSDSEMARLIHLYQRVILRTHIYICFDQMIATVMRKGLEDKCQVAGQG